jgi:transcriptional regulator with XRE-family HTH domain
MNGATDSERLKAYVAERGLSQRDMAAQLGVSASYLNRLCNGRPLSDKFIGRLVRTFGAAAAVAVAGESALVAPGPRGAEARAEGIAFPPIERYHEVARPGLYEQHLFDALLFDGTVAARIPGARGRWSVDELLCEALVACGLLLEERGLVYQAPVEQWFTPRGETCVAYGTSDVADPDAASHEAGEGS